ncbi:MAG: hypothetical protein LBV47_08775 [Bacteroidales bacterium]|jgi:hypothetical protein|nr:hypothetical protein [Bacteroidales bacterium]
MKTIKFICLLLIVLTAGSCDKDNDSIGEDESTQIVDSEEGDKARDYRGYMLAIVEKLSFKEGDARRDSLLTMIDSDAERFFVGGDSYRDFLIPILEENSFYEPSTVPFFQHRLWLSFKDASGNDLTKGIGLFDVWVPGSKDSPFFIGDYYWTTGNEEEYIEGLIKPELYTLDIIFEDGIPNPLKPEPAPIINGYPAYVLNNPNPRLNISLKKGSSIKMHSNSTDLLPGVNPDCNYLYFDFKSYKIYGLPSALLYGIPAKEIPFTEKIILRLTCPYLFGDNEAHDIVTWWEPYIYENGEESIYAVCYRIEFEGKEITLDGQHYDVPTIILDI